SNITWHEERNCLITRLISLMAAKLGPRPLWPNPDVMAIQKPKILVTRRLTESIEARMATLFETDVNEADVTLTGDDILAGLEGKDVLVSSITDRIDADLIARMPKSV